MIYEGIVLTSLADGGSHIAPMGFRTQGRQLVLSPFVPSTTLANLRRTRTAVVCASDDVRVMAGALTGQRDWPVTRADIVDGWRLSECLSHWELVVDSVTDDAERPRFCCNVVHHASHAPAPYFNRAQAAVVEASILISRLEMLDSDKIARELEYLHIAIAKTAGPREQEAWAWLLGAVSDHPKHDIDTARWL